jgi:hypothetical protein
MIDKLNIKIENKQTKKIEYKLNLDSGYWLKSECNVEDRTIHLEDSGGYWFKYEYDNEGQLIYYENNKEVIVDDRKN